MACARWGWSGKMEAAQRSFAPGARLDGKERLPLQSGGARRQRVRVEMSESVLLKCHRCGKDNRLRVGEVIPRGCQECYADWFCDRQDAPMVAGIVTDKPAYSGKCYECGQQLEAPRCPVCTFCQSCCTHDSIRAERDEARAQACNARACWMEEHDDPEEWIRWWYHSGNSEWLKPPAWFLEKHPWCLPRQREE